MKNFLSAMGPFFVNTIVGMLIVLPASVDIFFFTTIQIMHPLNLFLAWIGLSILMHAFPSRGDADAMVQSILKNASVSIPVKIVVAPFIGLVYLGAFGSIVWLDALYAIGMAMVGPLLVMQFM